MQIFRYICLYLHTVAICDTRFYMYNQSRCDFTSVFITYEFPRSSIKPSRYFNYRQVVILFHRAPNYASDIKILIPHKYSTWRSSPPVILIHLDSKICTKLDKQFYMYITVYLRVRAHLNTASHRVLNHPHSTSHTLHPQSNSPAERAPNQKNQLPPRNIASLSNQRRSPRSR